MCGVGAEEGWKRNVRDGTKGFQVGQVEVSRRVARVVVGVTGAEMWMGPGLRARTEVLGERVGQVVGGWGVEFGMARQWRGGGW